ncbi:head decoration protein [Methylosinus sp. Sm6]|uniref:head decoration protein n=1 Tax=Methylosinus sp. Sm6 TaxID=2866948 RepID=UPI001C998AAA|nr:head decoration protein [Methylosinus sp. Sm6]MBY6239814.1 head decoration protein [Methylosinus sp. Sm6]
MGTPQGITLNETAHPFTFVVSEDSDGAGYLSRDEVIIGNSQTIVVGQVLARQAVPADVTISAAADAGNTGNGVLTLASPGCDANVIGGDYRVVFLEAATNSGRFEVFDPRGVAIGQGAVGSAFAKQVKFTIADGATDFVAGDSFTLHVDEGDETNEVHIAWAPGLRASAIAGYPATTGASTTKKITVINAHATVRLADLTFGGSPSTAQIDQAKRELGAGLVKFR